jgi:monoterpene epsilon-lactone hydrolase
VASKQATAIKDLYNHFLKTLGENPDMPIEEVRALLEHLADLGSEPGGVDYIEADCNGVLCMWANPKGASDKHVLLCTHGGGYVAGSIYSHRKLYAHIAKAVGCRAISVHYGLAPENPHPGPVNDCVKVYEWLLDEGFKPENIATTGDSAGGALSISIILAARDKGLPLPAAAMPICPWYDVENSGDSMKTNEEKDCLVKKAVVDGMAETFLAGGSSRDPLANPLYANLSGLPPLYITVSRDETLLDDAVRFEKIAREAGVEVKMDIFPEMQHVWHFMAGAAPEADQAVQQMSDWVRPKLGLT